MISISEGLFVVVIQAIVLLSLLSLALLVLLRSKQNKLNAYLCQHVDHSHASDTASIEHYFATEIKLTEGRFELLYDRNELQEIEFREPDWLVLRNKYLEMEKEMASSTDREEYFWKELGANLKRILDETRLVKRSKVEEAQEEDEDEIKELKNMLKQQENDFDNMLSELEANDEGVELETMKQKLIKLSRSHKELSHCIMVLEDENMFLRDQIAGLLNSEV